MFQEYKETKTWIDNRWIAAIFDPVDHSAVRVHREHPDLHASPELLQARDKYLLLSIVFIIGTSIFLGMSVFAVFNDGISSPFGDNVASQIFWVIFPLLWVIVCACHAVIDTLVFRGLQRLI